MLVHMIYTYIQEGVLATKSSHIKVPSQVSLIDCLVFKQQKTIESFILKHRHYHQLLQRWDSTNHHMVVTSLVRHTLPHPETSRIYLTPPLLPSWGRHLWMTANTSNICNGGNFYCFFIYQNMKTAKTLK